MDECLTVHLVGHKFLSVGVTEPELNAAWLHIIIKSVNHLGENSIS